jgi:hypothetical protein
MERQKEIFTERLKREHKLINRHYLPYALMLAVLLGVLVYVFWHTMYLGRRGEGIALSLILGFGYITMVGALLNRWLVQRKRARTQNTMSNSAAHAPTRRLDEVKNTGGRQCKTGEQSFSS